LITVVTIEALAVDATIGVARAVFVMLGMALIVAASLDE
jgi:hypothetical protein